VKVAVRDGKTHKPSDETCRVSRLRENLTSGSDGEGLETGRAMRSVPRQSFTRQLFFKWIKQNLKIKSVIGHTINAVATQIFVALCVYLLMAYLKFVSQSAFGIQSILRLLQMNLFLRRPLDQLLHKWKADPPPPQTAFSLRFA